ncbi:MAG: YgiQ family radical SAM protein [Lentisphaeria bacterium]|nr:YgiQ family radical SAM protein [Lentisphaeria bacterium]
MFLPTTREEMAERGWDELDVLLVSGDAYIDHPSFGTALLGRVLENAGYRVGVVAQPRWDGTEDIERMGRPRLYCGVSAGCLDSMLAHYTAFRKKRRDDAYTPGGEAGARPNRAVLVYSNLVRQAFPALPVVIGGIEASLRRAVHYDFWTNNVRRSVLLDSKADVLVYGMAEQTLVTLTERISNGVSLEDLPGTVSIVSEFPQECQALPSYEEILADPKCLLQATLSIERQVHEGETDLVQAHGTRFVRLNRPAPCMNQEQLDAVAELPFTRSAHPSYTEEIPALAMVQWSVTAVRGCGGGCSFCSLALHQGRRIRSRSRDSILREAAALARHPEFRGSITDVGGPTANLWRASCRANPSSCRRASCLAPRVCPHLDVPQEEYLELLRSVRAVPGVKHVRVASGVRHDLALECPDFMRGLTDEFVGGQLKVAPEHAADHVLKLMRKTEFSLFERFVEVFTGLNRASGREQYVIPYILSAFPGCTLADMRALAIWFRKQGWRPQQVQCFIPTPGTVATAMFHAECDLEGNALHVAKTDREREDQHKALMGTTRRGPAQGRKGKGKERNAKTQRRKDARGRKKAE